MWRENMANLMWLFFSGLALVGLTQAASIVLDLIGTK